METAASPVLDAADPERLRRAELKRFLIGCITAGAIIRLIVSGISIGSRDASYWLGFAKSASDSGLLQAYRVDSMLNHPIPTLMWACAALKIGGKAGFPFVFKLPIIAADLISCVLVARIWLKRADARRARLAIAAIAFNPLAILVSAYHCNTDSLMAMLCLLSMYFIAEKRNFLFSGLALGAAINVKLIPLLLIPAAFSFCENRREFVRLIAGLALWVIPYLPLLTVIDAIRRNMIAYVPQHERWGVSLFFYQLFLQPGWSEFAEKAVNVYSTIGRGLIILGAFWFAAVQWRTQNALRKPARNVELAETPIDGKFGPDRKPHVLNYGRSEWRGWNPYELGLLTFATFLVFAPGFGVQYTIMLLPLMVAVSIGRARAYSAAAGAFLFIVYFMTLVPDQFPLYSYFRPPVLPMPGPLFGLVAWLILCDLVVRMSRRGWGALAAR